MQLPRFEDLATSADATLDLLALALAAAFRPVDAARALATLDGLGAEVVRVLDGSARTPRAEALALSHVLGTVHGFTGDTEQYDRPENSMLDRVLERRRGLPILLSVVYVEAARRADVPLVGVGLPGHYVVAHFGGSEPLLLDPFSGGAEVPGDAPAALVRPWSPHQTAMRMLNNLVPAFRRRGDLTRALRAAEMRLALPADSDEHDRVRAELVALRAGLN
jgi:regulator of sirC expression with transglutaminase-like and TPR domain